MAKNWDEKSLKLLTLTLTLFLICEETEKMGKNKGFWNQGRDVVGFSKSIQKQRDDCTAVDAKEGDWSQMMNPRNNELNIILCDWSFFCDHRLLWPSRNFLTDPSHVIVISHPMLVQPWPPTLPENITLPFIFIIPSLV